MDYSVANTVTCLTTGVSFIDDDKEILMIKHDYPARIYTWMKVGSRSVKFKWIAERHVTS